MAKFEANFIKTFNHFADFLCSVFSFALAYLSLYLFQEPGFLFIREFGIKPFIGLFFVFYVINYFFFSQLGVYPTSRFRTFKTMALLYWRSIYFSLFTAVAFSYLLYRSSEIAIFLFIAAVYNNAALLAKEWFIRRQLAVSRREGKNTRYMIVAGDDETMIQYVVDEVQTNPLLGIEALGVVTTAQDHRRVIASLAVLGSLSELDDILERQVIDCVVFIKGAGDEELFREAVWKCEQRGLEVWIKLNVYYSEVKHLEIEHLNNLAFLRRRSGPQNASALMVKCLLDQAIALICIILFLPMLILFAILVKLTSSGPVFFKQYRAGINCRRFPCYKFRSMVLSAEAMKDALEGKNEMTGPVFKIKQDPRVTPIGRFMRTTSIDELPQLFNVLMGDMSLVGPRALPLTEARKTHGWQRRRFSMKPGITCLWQVSGRNRLREFDQWAKLDLKYIDEWSLWLDFKILFKTIPAVLECSGY